MSVSSDPFKVYMWGEPECQRTLLKDRARTMQDYTALKDANLSRGMKFSDGDFQPNELSVGSVSDLFDTATDKSYTNSLRNQGWDGKVAWMRIDEFVKSGGIDSKGNFYRGTETPVFGISENLSETFSRMDIQQGMVGDCWFVASLGAVALNPDIFEKCVPKDNATNDAGIYHFRFWYQGIWVDVVVDDYIPVMRFKKSRNGLRYYRQLGASMTRQGDQVEFWVTLAEKAFAKLNGNYSLLVGNSPANSFEAIAGGFGESVKLDKNVKLKSKIETAMEKGTFLALSTFPSSRAFPPPTSNRYNGIFYDHAYSITGIQTVHYKGPFDERDVTLIRIRNPHGKDEWTGAFSDFDQSWQHLSPPPTQEAVVADDGEFWMPYESMIENFDTLSALSWIREPTVNIPGGVATYFVQFGSWSKANDTCGGYRQPWKNPQYAVTIGGTEETGVAIVAGLTINKELNDYSRDYGFRVYALKGANETKVLPLTFMDMMASVGGVPAIYSEVVFDNDEKDVQIEAQQSSCRIFFSKPGRYILEPFLREENEEGDFCLRIVYTNPQ